MFFQKLQIDMIEIPEDVNCIPKYVFYILSAIIIPIVLYLKAQIKNREEVIKEKDLQYLDLIDEHVEDLKSQREKLEVIVSTIKKTDGKE